ncbi:hypothetical protein FSP39_010743 [Pinctada imbricata]|uniref:Steroid 17-alpha-hydroxylase/17,20 lyase n=1 Tax=Pinctada imbricata TaxID=66713 RepID=A0AA88Y726_PINIB|nr:hypothetical protein FSP39_010743 [Pinctada imbricata]
MAFLSTLLGLLSPKALVVGVIMGLITNYIYHRLKYKLPPGPWAIPLIGNWSIYSKTTMHREVAKLTDTYGPVIRIKFGPSDMIFLNSTEVVLEALVKKKADFGSRPSFKSAEIFSQGGKNIFFAPYSATWKFQKKVAGRALRYYMQGMQLENMINDVCGQIFERISKETEPVQINKILDKMVIHMLYSMCFGRKCNLEDKDVDRILQMNLELLDKFSSGFLEDIIPGMTSVYKTERWKEFEKITQDLISFLEGELKQHKDTFDSSNIRDYTDSILMAREEAETEEREEDAAMLSDVYIVQILSDIFFAGLDTTRMILDWFLSYMVSYPEYQDKCQEVIDKVLGLAGMLKAYKWKIFSGESKTAAVKDRPSLCFVEACIMETLRMGSVTAIGVPHSTICDTSVGGYDIPKGTMVVINHWALHNDRHYWKDVDTFNPYRYLTKDGKLDAKPENWLPFSAGRRVCLGEPVAKTELLLLASNLLRNFRFKAPSGEKYMTQWKCTFPGAEVPADYKVVVEKRTKD